MTDGRCIPEDKLQALRTAFDRGASPHRASLEVVVSDMTARRHFKEWGWKRASDLQPGKPRFFGLPVYVGPDWIGVAATPQLYPDPAAAQPAID